MTLFLMIKPFDNLIKTSFFSRVKNVFYGIVSNAKFMSSFQMIFLDLNDVMM